MQTQGDVCLCRPQIAMTLWQKARSYLHGTADQAAEQPRAGPELERASREASGTGTAHAHRAASQAARRPSAAANQPAAQQPAQVGSGDTVWYSPTGRCVLVSGSRGGMRATCADARCTCCICLSDQWPAPAARHRFQSARWVLTCSQASSCRSCHPRDFVRAALFQKQDGGA